MADETELQPPPLFDHPGSKKSVVWKYFAFYKKADGPATKDNLDMTKAVCRLCRKEYANKGNTTNLMSHLTSGHNEKILKERTDVNQKIPVQTKITQFSDADRTQLFSRPLTKERTEELNFKIMQLLVGKVLPFSLVDSPYFKDFCCSLDPRYKVPSRKTITTMLDKLKERVSQNLRATIAQSRDIAITHDGWTSIATESYQTVTAHFISQDWELKSAVLETKKLSGSHTAEAIAEALQETKTRWGLPVPTATTDNAANEKKAFEILGWQRFGCYGHRINLCVKKALSIPELSKILAKGRKLVTFFHQSTSACDLLRANQLNQFDFNVAHKLILDCPTRWNSTLSMLQRLLELTPAIMAVVHDPKVGKSTAEAIKLYSYTFEEQALVERITAILKPFEIATSILCAENVPTLPKVLPTLIKLKTFVTPQDGDSSVIQKFKFQLAEQIVKRSQDVDLMLLASVLNPCTKDMQILNNEERDKVNTLLRAHLQLISSKVTVKKEKVEDDVEITAHPQPSELSEPPLPQLNLMPTDSVDDISMPSPPKKPKLSLMDMESWLDDVVCTGQSQLPQITLVEQEISNYLAASPTPITTTKSTMLEWWKKNEMLFPRLSILAKKILAIPASSVPSERVFSLAGGLVCKKRARMNPDNIDTIIFLNKNMKDYS